MVVAEHLARAGASAQHALQVARRSCARAARKHEEIGADRIKQEPGDAPAEREHQPYGETHRNPAAALEAWREVARLAESRGDARSAARAFAIVGDLIAKRYAASDEEEWADAEIAWRKALDIDPLQAEAIAGLATAAAARGDHEESAVYYERLRGLGLPQHTAARHELMLARSLVPSAPPKVSATPRAPTTPAAWSCFSAIGSAMLLTSGYGWGIPGRMLRGRSRTTASRCTPLARYQRATVAARG